MFNKAIDLLFLAKQSKIDIVLNEGQLQLKLPKNTSIDKNLLQNIKDNKEAIVDFLKDNSRNTNSQNKITRFDRNSISKIPLSYSQERLWFIDRLEGSVQYHMAPVLRMKGKLNSKAVEYALEIIIDRHEILRTVFAEEQGHGYQVIKEKGNWKLSTVDGLAFKEDRAALQQYLEVLIKQPFDLSKDYMLRAHLIKIDDNDHVLAVIIHHIASDGWSISVLVKEVVELYNAFNENRPAILPILEIQYADYAVWQRELLAGEIFDKKLFYWKKKLEGVATLQLPTNYTRLAVQSINGATIQSVIQRDISIKLQDFSKQHEGTLFMTLLAAFKVLLFRYSGQQDICVGTPIAGRQQKELEGLIGFFVNTLAIRSEVNGEDTFIDFFRQVRKVTMEAFENQEIPFEKIVDEVVNERSLSRNPLFQVMMIYMNTPEVPELRLGEIKLSKENHERTTAKFDIQIFLTDTPDGLSMIIEYCTDLFSSATINRMIVHFKELLFSIINDPLQKISDLSMLPKAEEQKLLIELNNTARDYPKNKTVISLFEEQVNKTPDAVAVIFEEEQFTYSKLNKLANQLAHYLISKGVKKETLVPLCLERSPQMIVGIWGILKAGAAYVPIDPEYPEDRIRYMLEDSNSAFILTSQDCSDKISITPNIEAIILDNNFSLISNQPIVNPGLLVSNNHLAYVIYTSGSTGKPKGAMNEHGGLANRLFWAQDYFNLTHKDAVLQKTTFCFDVSVWELIWPLLFGARLIFAKPGGQKDNSYIKSVIEKNNITVLHFVPSMLNVFLPDLHQGDCASLRKILCSGEALKNSHVELFKKKLTNVELHNLYGPTEAAIDVTCWSLINTEQEINIIPIGKPIANTRIYILDKNENLTPLGGIGEIHIGGIQVARGYLNRPELTAQKFIADPFVINDPYKLYKTGDLGRWMPDGNIEYLGRKDDQVKIRGNRIELGEVETAINALKQVNNNCIVVKSHPDDTNTLGCYFIPNDHFVKDKERELYQSQILSWKELYENEYEQTEDNENVEEEFNIISWKDSFTGAEMPDQVMAEWVKQIVDKILAQYPENVLEIGCGTGLIYYQLAGKIKKYIGTDFSSSSIKQINHRISKGLRDYGPTELYISSAHEVKIKKEEQVDTIILNSVVQYFPGEEYLNDVIGNSINILNGRGCIIIGDVRDYRTLGLFKGRLQLNKMQPSVSVKEFKWAIEQDILKEEELCISPAYFYRLKLIYPTITHVDIQWKKVSFINELSLYRYDVIIYVGIQHPLLQLNWQPFIHQKDKLHLLEQIEKSVDRIALKDVYNPRLWKEKQLSLAMENKTVNSIRDLVSSVEDEGKENKDIREVLNFAETKGYQYRFFLNEDPLKVNILLELDPSESFIRQDYNDEIEPHNNALTNHPLFADISFLLQKDIKDVLKQNLPEYMVPSEMIALTRLPLNNNGKTDRKFLSERGDISIAKKFIYQPPVTELQSKLAFIWQELLHIVRVGIEDNFFDLGGHSLLVMRMISAVRRDLGVELAIKDIFLYSTISKLSGHIESLQGTALLIPAIGAFNRPEHIPLSFSQERLWFIDQFEGSLHYHIPSVFRLKGALNIKALEYALQQIINRHEILRTVIYEEKGEGYQYIQDKDNWYLTIVDGSKYHEDIDGLKYYIQQLISEPFDLSKDYMLRADLIRLNIEYVLVVTLHHMASDGWSTSILVTEMVELYRSYKEAREPELAQLSIQYADYAIWQRKYLQGDVLQKKLEYWKNKLEDVSPLQLPLDYPRPAVQSIRGAVKRFRIDKELSEQLQILGQQHGATLFMTLLAAFKVLLNRYSGQQDICVGTPIAGRQQYEVESLIGFFINTLALRSDLNNNFSFAEVLHQVKDTTLEAYGHQEVPFEKIVDAVVKERIMSRPPLFQVMFILQNTPEIPMLSFGDVQLSKESFSLQTSKFDLTLSITETHQGLHGFIVYCADLFSEKTISRMIRNFKALLQSIVKEPKQNIRELAMLTKAEEHQLLVEFNNSIVQYPAEKSMIDLFEAQVVKTPETIAVAFEGLALTYKELNERSNQLGHYLRNKGVKEETLVPICVERSAEMIVAILGILKAGAAYVPIDADYPVERIKYILEDTEARVAITGQTIISRLPASETLAVIAIDTDWPTISREAKTNLQNRVQANHLAYVIYTSGSTGSPKGVMIEHNALLDHCFGVIKSADLISCRSFALFSPLVFDAGHSMIHSAFILGASLHILSKELLSNGGKLHDYINDNAIDCIKIVPSLWMAYADGNNLILSKKVMIFGGESFSISILDCLVKCNYSGEVYNHYGPTEATIGKCIHKLDFTRRYSTIPIGKPFSNTRLYILDQSGRLVPVGVAGELHISGNGLAREYLNQPELTAAKFITDPFSKNRCTKMYKTGDMARWLNDGNIEYLGRIDNQVKIRGFRIELGEIESVLQRSEFIQEAVVLAKDDKKGDKRLVGYIVPAPERSFSKEVILSYLRSKLPEYMVPGIWVEVESMPLTSNGKVNIKNLPEPDEGLLINYGYVGPRNEVEEKLADIWKELLNLERVGIYDNFFELGGHSLLTMRMRSAIEGILLISIPIQALFQFACINDLSRYIEIQSDNGYHQKNKTVSKIIDI